MGPTLSPGLPTSLAAQAWGPGPWAPFPGLSTRLVSSWVLGGPLGLFPFCLACSRQQQPLCLHLFTVLWAQLQLHYPSPAPLLFGESWEGEVGVCWHLCGICGQGAGFQSLMFGFFGPNPKETDKPSLFSLVQLQGTSRGDELQVVTSTDGIPWNLNHCLFLDPPHSGSHPASGTKPFCLKLTRGQLALVHTA